MNLDRPAANLVNVVSDFAAAIALA